MMRRTALKTLKALYAKDVRRNRQKRSSVGEKKLVPGDRRKTGFRSTVIQTRNSDGQVMSWYIYRCVHCQEYEGSHVDGCCLFMPTKFREMTESEDAAAFPPEPRLTPIITWITFPVELD